MKHVHVVGAGLAGSEAAWQLAGRGVPVVLHEMRPTRMTDAHKTDRFAELVCSNSFRSDDASGNAVGLLHAEMRDLGSLIMRTADRNQVPAGGALAVDRERFADEITAALEAHPLITIERSETTAIRASAASPWIIATGPLTSSALADAIRTLTGSDALAFFDAIAPIVYADSIDLQRAWFQSRYDKPGPGGTGADYLNCPMDRERYEAFVQALRAAETVPFKDWEASTPYFEGCLPIEEMAARGLETLRHGPLKPFGLTNAHDPGNKPYAVVQLRQDNIHGTLFNMVGFQTKMRHGEQTRVLRMIPGLENAVFARLGGLHRNTYVDAPRLLDPLLRLRRLPELRFAGQITGCEGYVESAAIGLLAGLFAAADAAARPLDPPPQTTAMGALLGHITGNHMTDANAAGSTRSYQPMNVNFGLFPPAEPVPIEPSGPRARRTAKRLGRKTALVERARRDFAAWCPAPIGELAA